MQNFPSFYGIATIIDLNEVILILLVSDMLVTISKIDYFACVSAEMR